MCWDCPEERTARHLPSTCAKKGFVRDMEYYFSDTGKELPEVYQFLDKMECYLGVEIKRLSAERDFDHYMKIKGHWLPSPQRRWVYPGNSKDKAV